MAYNGRFAYQPLSEEFAKDSQPGQLIMNRFDGHISANKNGIIVSKTKEIEDKLEDINELKHDVDEQTDVILNLLEDIETFLKGDFEDAVEAQNKTYEFGKKILLKIKYLDQLDKGTAKKIERIKKIILNLEKANDLQVGWMDDYEVDADRKSVV